MSETIRQHDRAESHGGKGQAPFCMGVDFERQRCVSDGVLNRPAVFSAQKGARPWGGRRARHGREGQAPFGRDVGLGRRDCVGNGDFNRMGIFSAQKGARPWRGRGAVLLEVIFSMGLLLFGMSVVGGQIVIGLKSAKTADTYIRSVLLVDMVMAELEGGRIRLSDSDSEVLDDEQGGGFGLRYPGYSWKMDVEETEIDDLYMIKLDIGYSEADKAMQLEDPDYETEFDDREVVIYTVYRLWGASPKIDLERDFGIKEEDLEKMLGALGLAGLLPEGDGEVPPDGGVPSGAPPVDPNVLGDLLPGGLPGGDLGDLDISAVLELLTRQDGFDPRDLADLLGEEGGQFAELLQQVLGGGTNLNDLLGQVDVNDLMNLLNGGGGRGGNRGRAGRRGGRDAGEDNAESGDRPDLRERLNRRRGGERGGEEELSDQER